MFFVVSIMRSTPKGKATHLSSAYANADVGKSPTHWRVIQTRIKSDARSLKLLAYVRDMHGGFYICIYIYRQDFFKPLTYYIFIVSAS